MQSTEFIALNRRFGMPIAALTIGTVAQCTVPIIELAPPLRPGLPELLNRNRSSRIAVSARWHHVRMRKMDFLALDLFIEATTRLWLVTIPDEHGPWLQMLRTTRGLMAIGHAGRCLALQVPVPREVWLVRTA